MSYNKVPVPSVLATGNLLVNNAWVAQSGLSLDSGSDGISTSTTITNNGTYVFQSGVSLELTSADSVVSYTGSVTDTTKIGFKYPTAANVGNIVWFYGTKIPSLTQCNFYTGSPIVLAANTNGSDVTVLSVAIHENGELGQIKVVKLSII